MPDHATGAPPLQTERLILRAHRVADLGDLAAMWAEPEVVRHISGTPSSREDSWSRLLRYAGMWPLCGYGYWAIEDKATGRFAGEVGFADFAREMVPPFYAPPEAGWVLAPWAHGRGYATEAMLAVLGWADRTLAPAHTLCLLAPENAASMRVAEKCGYRRFAEASYRGYPTLLYRR